MRRRGVGIAAVKAKQKWKEEMETVGTELQETRAEV